MSLVGLLTIATLLTFLFGFLRKVSVSIAICLGHFVAEISPALLCSITASNNSKSDSARDDCVT